MDIKDNKYRLSAAESEVLLMHISSGGIVRGDIEPIILINYLHHTLEAIRRQVTARMEFEQGIIPSDEAVTRALDQLGDSVISLPVTTQTTPLLAEAAESVAFYAAAIEGEKYERFTEAASGMLCLLMISQSEH